MWFEKDTFHFSNKSHSIYDTRHNFSPIPSLQVQIVFSFIHGMLDHMIVRRLGHGLTKWCLIHDWSLKIDFLLDASDGAYPMPGIVLPCLAVRFFSLENGLVGFFEMTESTIFPMFFFFLNFQYITAHVGLRVSLRMNLWEDIFLCDNLPPPPFIGHT